MWGSKVWVCVMFVRVHVCSPCLTQSHAECQTSDHRTLMRTRSEPTQHSTPTPSTPQSDPSQIISTLLLNIFRKLSKLQTQVSHKPCKL